MKSQLIKTGKVALPVLLAFSAIPAFAVDVTFTTWGVFTPASGDNGSGYTFTSGAATLASPVAGYSTTAQLNGVDLGAGVGASISPANQQVYTNGSNTLTLDAYGQNNVEVNLGPPALESPILFTALETGTGLGQVALSGNFTLYIEQNAVPGGPDGSNLVGSLSGTVGIFGNDSIPNVHFNQTTLTLGSVIYSLSASDFDFTKPSSQTLQSEGYLTVGVAPEPTFYALTGLGLAGLLGMAIARKRQSSEA